MKVKILKDCSYSANGFTVIERVKGEVVKLPKDVTEKFIARGLCEPYELCDAINPKELSGPIEVDIKELFTPVEETAVIEPVKEVKKRRRKKKAE